ncbi:Rieske (2Fe-2S) protein [Nocardioides sp. W7]|uniref:Rieske (2Fe-2S) protein n=1 Tax=Nocardioides sp. W7 TaxID=2931390 RepID=UPI001FD0A6AD|nr:Rieske (2Fe-2S) protein [Nocardioides sp. W7]
MTTESRTTSTPDAPKAVRGGRACACLSRRHALAGAVTVGVGVPFLAACGGDDASSGVDAPSSSSGGSSPAAPATSEGAGAPAEGLTTTADIPVGGGKIFGDEGVVITQPTEGEFKGFTNICTHQGCPVTGVEDGTINCSCHHSSFSIEDGSVEGGPASSALKEIVLTVNGDAISIA